MQQRDVAGAHRDAEIARPQRPPQVGGDIGPQRDVGHPRGWVVIEDGVDDQLAGDARPRRLVLEMSGVDFIDCAAARLIASTGRFLPEGRRPVIRHPSPVLRRLLELTGLAAHCEVDNPSG